MGIVVIGAVFIDIKGHSLQTYIPGGRNVGAIEHIHGGVARNVAEDIANVELKPTFISIVDDTPLGDDVIRKLKKHKVNTDYIGRQKDGMGTWLAVFDHQGDVVASVSKRPDVLPILRILEDSGDEIFKNADSICLEIDMDKDVVKKVFELAQKHKKDVYALVSNMSIAVQRRDFIRSTACFVCNQQEAGILFSEDYSELSPDRMQQVLAGKLAASRIPRMVVTMGGAGAVYADASSALAEDEYISMRLKGAVYADASSALAGEDRENGAGKAGQHKEDGAGKAGQYSESAAKACAGVKCGFVPSVKVDVVDTTGAGDSFFAGTAMGLTYGKSMEEACRIGARLAASVITTHENVCPRFMPAEFDLPACI